MDWHGILDGAFTPLFKCAVAGVWIYFWVVTGRNEKRTSTRWPWFLAVVVCAGLSWMQSARLGSHRVYEGDEDPLYGMAEYEEDYEPTAIEQLEEGIRSFLILMPLACWGIWYGMKYPGEKEEDKRSALEKWQDMKWGR